MNRVAFDGVTLINLLLWVRHIEIYLQLSVVHEYLVILKLLLQQKLAKYLIVYPRYQKEKIGMVLEYLQKQTTNAMEGSSQKFRMPGPIKCGEGENISINDKFTRNSSRTWNAFNSEHELLLVQLNVSIGSYHKFCLYTSVLLERTSNTLI